MEEFKKVERKSLTEERRDRERAQAGRNLLAGIATIIGTAVVATTLEIGGASPDIVSLPIVLGSTTGSSLICSYFRQKKKEQIYKDVDAALGIKREK
jgi:hypothetical protein